MVQRGSTVRLMGVPLDLGANMRGANIGPAAVRIAGIHEKIKVLGHHVEDEGDLAVPIRDTLSASEVAEHFLPNIISICSQLSDHVNAALQAGRIPIALGGDHSLAIGSIAGASDYYRKKQQNMGLLWIDAHADMNTPASSPTGNIHGMPLAVAIGKGHKDLVNLRGFGAKLRPENVALVGIRTLDAMEKDLCKQSGIRYFTMREIDERGMHAVMKEAIEVVSRGTAGIHLSFDMDGVDPLYAPGVSTPVTGGLSYREAHLALEMLADTQKLASMDFVELNPMCDDGHKTAHLLVELVQSALGKAIV